MMAGLTICSAACLLESRQKGEQQQAVCSLLTGFQPTDSEKKYFALRTILCLSRDHFPFPYWLCLIILIDANLKTSLALSSHYNLTESMSKAVGAEVISVIVIIVLLYEVEQEVCRPEEVSSSTQYRAVTLVSE